MNTNPQMGNTLKTTCRVWSGVPTIMSPPTCVLVVSLFSQRYIQPNASSSKAKCLLVVKCTTYILKNITCECINMYITHITQYLCFHLCVFYRSLPSIFTKDTITGDNTEQSVTNSNKKVWEKSTLVNKAELIPHNL